MSRDAVSLGFTVRCGACRASWFVPAGDDPFPSLEAHGATKHAGEDLGPAPEEAAAAREPETTSEEP